jgi:two-component system response regulator AtoC
VVDHPQKSVRILVVTRELALQRLLSSGARLNPWHVETSEHAWEVLDRIQEAGGLQLLVLDTAYAERDSLHLLQWLGCVPREFPIIVICQSQDASTKDEAMRLGANQVMTRPLRENELEAGIHRALDSFKRRSEVELHTGNEDDFFLSVSLTMQKVWAQAELLARADVPALIVAEPGSGAATVAHLIHRLSANSGYRFRRLNCATLAMQLAEPEPGAQESYFDGGLESVRTLLDFRQPGTLLLEGIEELPAVVQARLLQILDATKPGATINSRPKVRILATAAPDIERAVAQNKLREDLYSRLSAFTIQIPAPRRRKDEIEVLLRYSMYKMANQFKQAPRDFSRETLEACLSYSWPGNIRELESFVKHYLFAEPEAETPRSHKIAVSPVPAIPAVAVSDAQDAETSAESLKAMIQDLTCKAERNAIAAALQKTHWNRKAAARLLRVSYRTLLYKIERYQMCDTATSLGPNTN